MALHTTHNSAVLPPGNGKVAFKVETLLRRHWLRGDFPTLEPCHTGKQFTQPMRQRLLQGGAFQFSYVHGNSRFHDAVNIAYIVNMLKPIFPLFF